MNPNVFIRNATLTPGFNTAALPVSPYAPDYKPARFLPEGNCYTYALDVPSVDYFHFLAPKGIL